MKATQTAQTRPELSYDGCGINGPDEYRTRIATFTVRGGQDAQHYGPLFAAAPELLAALQEAKEALIAEFDRKQLLPESALGQIIQQCASAIARATNG